MELEVPTVAVEKVPDVAVAEAPTVASAAEAPTVTAAEESVMAALQRRRGKSLWRHQQIPRARSRNYSPRRGAKGLRKGSWRASRQELRRCAIKLPRCLILPRPELAAESPSSALSSRASICPLKGGQTPTWLKQHCDPLRRRAADPRSLSTLSPALPESRLLTPRLRTRSVSWRDGKRPGRLVRTDGNTFRRKSANEST